MANMAEDRSGRGAVDPDGQWEAARSLAFSRWQTLWLDHPAAVREAHAAAG
jgi:ABC-type amino acid transport system permease subunit